MPVVENLTLEAAVSDDFTDQLAELQASLLDIAQTAESVFPIDVDESGLESTIGELETLDAAVSAVDDDVTIDVGSDADDVSDAGLLAGLQQTVASESPPEPPTPTSPDTGDGLATSGGRTVTDLLTRVDDQLSIGQDGVGVTTIEELDASTVIARDADVLEFGGSADIATTIDQVDTANIDGDADILGFGESGVGTTTLADLDTDGIDPDADPLDFGDGDVVTDQPDRRALREALAFDGLSALGGDGPVSRFASRLRNVDFTIADFNQAFVALVPLTVALIGALPAAIAGLAALGVAAVGAAGALGALGGLAIFGAGLGSDGEFSTENLQDEVDEIQEAFSEAFTPLARDLTPLVDESVNGIERLFDALAARGDALRAFTDEARAFGSFLIDRIPVVVSQLLGFAEALSPILGGIGEAFASRRFFRGLAELAASAIPPLTALGNALQDIVPGLVRLSTGFLIAFSAVAGFLGGLFRVLEAFGPLTTLLGFAIGGFLIYASVLKLATVLNGLLGASVLATAKKYLIQANTAIFAAQGTSTLARAVAVLRGALTALAISLVTIFPLLGALGAFGGSIGGQFAGVDSNIRSATDALRQFGKQSRRVDGASFSGPSAGTPAGVGGGGNVQQTTVNVQTDGSTDDAFAASNTASFNTNT